MTTQHTHRVWRNPWLRDMAQAARDSGLEYGSADVDSVRRHAPEVGACGHITHFKPTVGTYVCPTCGAVRSRFAKASQP
jgi:predicted RNA-binding Zn-ribbon protein involved in translation (DUF1610 family)